MTYSEELGEWTAAQVTDLDPEWRTAGVLELDWSGPEPASVEDLGALVPLRLTHHAHNGRLSHCNFEWVLPRSYRVLGTAPVLHDGKSNSYGSGWRVGDQLARQRRWDRGDTDTHHRIEWTLLGAEIAGLAAAPEVRSVSVKQIDAVDGGDVAALFPNLTHLSLSGNLGTLSGAAGLNRLRHLRSLFIRDLFGMTAADCLTSAAVPELEMLVLHSVPADYATAMRKAWTPEIPNGTSVDISSPRKPSWVAENRDNPLRDWDGREHISAAQYRKSLAQYKATRRAVLAALAAPGEETAARLTELGRQFGEAFNRLDAAGDGFIETVEREELFAALDGIVEQGRAFDSARRHLTDGVKAVRDW